NLPSHVLGRPDSGMLEKIFRNRHLLLIKSYGVPVRQAPGACTDYSAFFCIQNPSFFTMSELIRNVSDASFDAEVLQADGPVLVDYWAAWCGPCKMIAPLLDEAAKQYEGRVTIVKLNVDENPETAARFGVRGIPTLMLFKDGKAAATKVGALSKSQLAAFLDESV